MVVLAVYTLIYPDRDTHTLALVHTNSVFIKVK